jgi:pimeloyl-ACP methyl ester carboxylesterase
MKPKPFRVAIPNAPLRDLRTRLRRTRWPDDQWNEDWRYGMNKGYLQDLVKYWIDGYDWRVQEAAINELPQFKVLIDGVPIHFVHMRGKGPAPKPLLLTHGWPSTFWDLRKMIYALADPAAHGGDPADAFDVIVPSLPGFAFSSPLPRPIDAVTTADLWVKLMRDVLGYDRFGAQGQDWGSVITQQLGHKYPQFLTGIHLSRYANPFTSDDPKLMGTAQPQPEDFAPEEAGWYERNKEGLRRSSHMAVQSTNPQTLAYAMTDSPAGMAAWLLEKRRLDAHLGGDVENVFSRDDQISNVMLFWLTNTFVSSVRYYWEHARGPKIPSHNRTPQVETPTAIGVLPRDAIASPRKWAEAGCNLQRWTVYTAGGHYGVYQVYDQYTDDLRAFFRGRS